MKLLARIAVPLLAISASPVFSQVAVDPDVYLSNGVPTVNNVLPADNDPLIENRKIKEFATKKRKLIENAARTDEKQLKHDADAIERERMYGKPADSTESGTHIGNTPGDQLIDAPKPITQE